MQCEMQPKISFYHVVSIQSALSIFDNLIKKGDATASPFLTSVRTYLASGASAADAGAAAFLCACFLCVLCITLAGALADDSAAGAVLAVEAASAANTLILNTVANTPANNADNNFFI
jgi:hypothetical protein